MIRFLFLLFALIGTTPSFAETFPALYDVTGVASDDTLNVRTEPSTDGEILGLFAPHQTGIEVIRLSEDRRWAQVNVNGMAGWASTQFLTLSQDYSYLPTAHLNCFGTEPFWSLDKPATGNMTSSILGDRFETWQPSLSARSANMQDRFSVIGSWGEDVMVLRLEREICTDGMSDQLFSISADFIRLNAEDLGHLSGCCTIQAD
ncbi:SH3 domain-containing protein [Octadecabacter sp. CECT 8868]|uniref:SH3 domain-containing protein n=1 Tax=Octadecabacter algicola TaxID=2909342 RepID=UPI001F2EF249|nr:SH3 domain-containing protein [Octadecabacter algicola]MCF2906087.1 SH3 domain-containing protein [Octadecabacter algicola]